MATRPNLPSNMAEKCNQMYKMFRTGATYTKEELSNAFGASERATREMISYIAKRRPIIATSDRRGYRLAIYTRDYEDCKHQYAELQSRIDELTARKQPLEQFCKACEEMKRQKQS